MRALLLLGIVVLAGCADVAEPGIAPAAEPTWILPLEAETATGCGASEAYRAWASDGIVLVIQPPCTLVFEGRLPTSAELVSIQYQTVDGGRAKATVDGQSATAPMTPGQGVASEFQPALRLGAGPVSVSVAFSGEGRMEIDALRVVGLDPLPGAATSGSGDGGNAIEEAGEVRLEAEDHTGADAACDPDRDRQRTSTLPRSWASGGEAVRLPRSGCGITFDEVAFSAESRFTTARAAIEPEGVVATVEVRVIVGGDVVARFAIEAQDGAPAEVTAMDVQHVAAGKHAVRVDMVVTSGSLSTDALVDFVAFETA